MKTEISFLLLKPSIAAAPVSPEVAAITVKCSRFLPILPLFLLTRKNSYKFPKNCNATSLKALYRSMINDDDLLKSGLSNQ